MSQFSIYFVRHGQTIFNVFNRMQGWSDSPLTDQGKKTAKQVGQELAHVDFAHYYSCLLYTSPSPRDGATSRMPSSA